MAIRKVDFVEGEYFHIYNRGNSRQKIFHDKKDYDRFIGLLFACNSKNNFKSFNLSKVETLYDFERGNQLVYIGAYCLMPNHFHILLIQAQDGGISKFMQKVSTAYSMYYNKKYQRTGGLFEAKFKAEHANTDNYLKYLFSYIHLNPIKLIQKDWKDVGIKNKRNAMEYLSEYIHSSYSEYLGLKRVQGQILNKEAFPKYFPNEDSFTKEIFTWLGYGDDLSS